MMSNDSNGSHVSADRKAAALAKGDMIDPERVDRFMSAGDNLILVSRGTDPTPEEEIPASDK